MSGPNVSVHPRTSVPAAPAKPALRPTTSDSSVSDLEHSDGVDHQAQPHAPKTAPRGTSLPGPTHQADAASLRNPARANTLSERALAHPNSDFAAAVEQAKDRGLTQLTLEVSKSTRFSRNIVSRMTLAGLGISMGLLFAGQPLAVVLVVPAMAAIGVGLRYFTRTRLNDGTKPHIEAFKALMATADEQTKASPEYAHALKLYKFLGGRQANQDVGQAQAHLADAYSEVASRAFSDHTEQAGQLAYVERGRDDVSDVHALREANLQILHANPPPKAALPPEGFEVGDADDGVPKDDPLHLESDPILKAFFGDHEEEIAAWHIKNPGVDSKRSFDERDIASYENIKREIRSRPGASLIPTWSLSDRVFKALGLELADRKTEFTASELRLRLRLGDHTDVASDPGNK